jgi:hypothetical protein
VNQNVLSPRGGPGFQPPMPHGSRTMPQQPPLMVPPPVSVPNQLANQLSGMNISGQPPQPPIQNLVSKIYFSVELLVFLLCLYALSVWISFIHLLLNVYITRVLWFLHAPLLILFQLSYL